MEGERPSPPSPPQLQGVIIISLPPPDDPSKGKTITAFTFSNDSPPAPPLLVPSPAPSSVPRSYLARTGRRSFLSRRRAVVFAVGAAFLLFSLWICLFSESPLQMVNGIHEENESKEERSFLFQLYPKSGRRFLQELGDVKLGSFGFRHYVGSWKMKSSRRMEASNSSAVFPIGGNLFPDGQYYTTIFVGSSPRPYFLDVDTGSDLTWIQCDAPCTSCAKGPHPLYKPNRGNIVLPSNSLCMEAQRNQNYHYCDSCEQCDYEIEYADHSSSMGVLARDDMHIIDANGGKAKFSFTFGCAYDQQGQLLASPAKTDGILGLSSSKISLPSQLENQGIISNVIGHCIKREAKGGGYMFLGDDYVPRWGMTWVPRQSGLTNFYISKASKINYGGKQISGQKGNVIPVIFDTGSSYTYFPDEAYGKLATYFQFMSNNFIQDVSDLTMPICLRADFPIRSFKDVKQFFEPLTLQFEKKWWAMSKSFIIQPEGYLVISDKGNVCLGVLNGTEVHDGSTVILGDISLRGKLVVYDNTQQKIGWIQSECAKPQKSTGFSFFV